MSRGWSRHLAAFLSSVRLSQVPLKCSRTKSKPQMGVDDGHKEAKRKQVTIHRTVAMRIQHARVIVMYALGYYFSSILACLSMSKLAMPCHNIVALFLPLFRIVISIYIILLIFFPQNRVDFFNTNRILLLALSYLFSKSASQHTFIFTICTRKCIDDEI